MGVSFHQILAGCFLCVLYHNDLHNSIVDINWAAIKATRWIHDKLATRASDLLTGKGTWILNILHFSMILRYISYDTYTVRYHSRFLCEMGMISRIDSIYVLALQRSLIILVGLTMTWYSEKMHTWFHAQLAQKILNGIYIQ